MFNLKNCVFAACTIWWHRAWNWLNFFHRSHNHTIPRYDWLQIHFFVPVTNYANFYWITYPCEFVSCKIDLILCYTWSYMEQKVNGKDKEWELTYIPEFHLKFEIWMWYSYYVKCCDSAFIFVISQFECPLKLILKKTESLKIRKFNVPKNSTSADLDCFSKTQKPPIRS